MNFEEKPKDFETIIAEKDARIEELEALVESLKSDLMHDKLTGLETRGYFEKEMREIISSLAINPQFEKRKERFQNVSFLFCDIDNFKKINDEQGHNAGDEILKKVARVLGENVRDIDAVCRWGGEEIIIGLVGADETGALEKAEQLRKKVEEVGVSASIGVSSFELGLNFEELVKRSDSAMYLAKKEGKNRVRTFSQVRERENGSVA